MIRRVTVTIILTVFLIGIPYLVFQNYRESLVRSKELTAEFAKIESQEIEGVKMSVWNSSDSLLLDTVVFDKKFCRQLREELLRLPEDSGPSSRLVWSKKISMDVLTTTKEHISIDLYATDNTALILLKTKSKDWVEGLDDLYSSVELKKMFDRILPPSESLVRGL